jgi:predicted aldo/keto reductase-like oxidoreductase
MDTKKKRWSRRDFLKTAGATGACSMLLPTISRAGDSDKPAGETAKGMPLPTRPFGKTGVRVPILALGGSFDTQSNQLLLRQALKLGVAYWETAEIYGWGRCEKGYGKYFVKYPEDRKKVFLVTKTISRIPADMRAALEGSLERLSTSYIDLYLWHMIGSLDSLYDKAVRDWVERMKSEGKIRYFGFSTHQNVEESMITAAKLGGIDGIQTSYNFRLMHTDRMKKAVDACVNAGIGLTAMKTASPGVIGRVRQAPELTEREMELLSKLTGHFLKKGFTDIQARLMAVWQNPHIASICSYMPNMTILKANVDAALNWRKLSRQDMNVLKQYARVTACDYCAGCATICESAVEGTVPISDVMRYLMYYHGYGDRERARSLFNELPLDARRRIGSTNYANAERRCPQRMLIGRLMRKAARELA